MAIGESQVLYGDRNTVHGRFDNKENNVILEPELLSGSHGSSDSSSLFSSDTSSEDFIEVDVKNVGYVIPNPTPPVQMMERDGQIPKAAFESPAPVEWSAASNDSLFSIHHGSSSFGGDQTMMLALEICTPEEPTIPNDLPFNLPPASVELIREVNISEYKMKQCGWKKDTPKPVAKQTNPSHRSNESESSSYSFAFPILVPGLQQNGSEKAKGVSTQHSREESHMDGESSISRPSTTPSSQKKHRWCRCFPFRSCCKPHR